MAASKTLRFDYDKHMDTPVKLRFVHDYEHYYNLEFCLLDGSREKWHAVQEYHHPLRGDRPGSCGEYIVYGNWTNRWFKVESPEDAKKQFEKFKSTLKTVGDIYKRFIERDVRAREEDIEAYDRKMERENALPDCIE